MSSECANSSSSRPIGSLGGARDGLALYVCGMRYGSLRRFDISQSVVPSTHRDFRNRIYCSRTLQVCRTTAERGFPCVFGQRKAFCVLISAEPPEKARVFSYKRFQEVCAFYLEQYSIEHRLLSWTNKQPTGPHAPRSMEFWPPATYPLPDCQTFNGRKAQRRAILKVRVLGVAYPVKLQHKLLAET